MMIHNFDPIFIDLGFFQIRWYSVAYILGILLGWVYAHKIINKTLISNNFTSVKTSNFDDLVIYLIIGIILGGRLGYVFFYNFEYYIQNYHEILAIWKGGMSFHGGLFGLVCSTIIFSKTKNLNFFNLTDIISCVAPIGLFLGRIANFINGELYGKATDVPWAIIFPTVDNISRHPSQIYEAILEGIFLFFLINYFAIKKKLLLKTGYVSCLFLIAYSILRILSEYFREPDIQIGYIFNHISLGSILSFITLLAGLFIIFFIKKNEQNN